MNFGSHYNNIVKRDGWVQGVVRVVNIHSPDVDRNSGSIDVVDTFVFGISFLLSKFWRTVASLIAGSSLVMACHLGFNG